MYDRYPHLPQKCLSFVGKYSSTMERMGLYWNNLWSLLLLHVVDSSSGATIDPSGVKNPSLLAKSCVPTFSGWWYTYPSEKYESVGMMTFQYDGKNKTCSKPPTREGSIVHLLAGFSVHWWLHCSVALFCFIAQYSLLIFPFSSSIPIGIHKHSYHPNSQSVDPRGSFHPRKLQEIPNQTCWPTLELPCTLLSITWPILGTLYVALAA